MKIYERFRIRNGETSMTNQLSTANENRVDEDVSSSNTTVGKRKRDDQATSKDTSAQGSSSSAPLIGAVNLEWFLSHFKKDTLQNMCEDLEVPVSGNKPDLVARIMKANHM